MPRSLPRLHLSFAALGLALSALAGSSRAQGEPAADSHARINSERRDMTRRAAQEQAECHKRFLVTACLEDVQSRQRKALQALRERELRLNDEERRERTARRKSELAQRQLEAEARPASPAESEPSPPKAHAVPASGPWARRPADVESDSPARAAERAEAARKRRDDAAERQDRVIRRQLDRAASGKQADPLPVPAAAASWPGR